MFFRIEVLMHIFNFNNVLFDIATYVIRYVVNVFKEMKNKG